MDFEEDYEELTKATGCSNATDTLTCLRRLNVTDLQLKSPEFRWTVSIDDDILVAPLYQMYEQRRFRQVPTIYGGTTDEGPTTVLKTVTKSMLDYILRAYLGNVTDHQLEEIKTMYPESLNQVSFAGIVLQDPFPGAGDEWERLGAIVGDMIFRCVSAFMSDMIDVAGNTQNWHYHYDVLDPRGEADGTLVAHTIELNAIWGPNNMHGGDTPPSYLIPNEDGGDAGIVAIMQSYWISFVRTYDPNALRAPGLAKWTPWTLKGRQRLLIHSDGTSMEKMPDAERDRCKLGIQHAKALNLDDLPLTTLPPFANGTFPDPYQQH